MRWKESALAQFGLSIGQLTWCLAVSSRYRRSGCTIYKCYTLKEAIDFIRNNGKKGIEIQPLQRVGRDERRPVVGDDDGPGKTDADPHHAK